MKASDGKFYLTDTADEATILEILKLVSPHYLPTFRQWSEGLEKGGRDQVAGELTPDSLTPHPSHLSYPQVMGRDQGLGVRDEKKGEKEINDDAELMLLIDAYHTSDLIIIKAFTAGIKLENISISATSKSVTIKGERKIPRGEMNGQIKIIEKKYSCQELNWGKFSRTIELPYAVKEDGVEAREDGGLVIIKLPLIHKIVSRKRLKMRTI